MREGRGTDLELAAVIASSLAASVRSEGVPVAVGSVVDLARAFLVLGTLERDALYFAGRAVLVHGPEDFAAYDAAFARCFLATPPGAAVLMHVPVAAELDDSGDGPEPDGTAEAGQRFSASERLGSPELVGLSDGELAEIARLVAELARVRPGSVSRRYVPTSREDARVDLRRSVALSVRTDGELIRRRYRRRRHRTRRTVVLCDVSGSMEPYARAMLRFAHAVARSRPRVEVFTMGTRLTRLTRHIDHRDPNGALAQAGAEILDWSGGTRLGEALKEFNDHFGVRGMARSATVLICSDGIDRGDPALIAEQMSRLSRVAHRVVWVNPLKSTPGYEPLARGMAAALPFVDDFLPGDSFAAFELAARVIAS